jgi:membrane protease YdiL (CAAX protease family)
LGVSASQPEGQPPPGAGARGPFPDAFQTTVLCMLSVLPDGVGAGVAAGTQAVFEAVGVALPPWVPAVTGPAIAVLTWAPVLWLGARWAGLPWRRAYPLQAVPDSVVPGFVVAEGGLIVLLAGLAAWGARVLPAPELLAPVVEALGAGDSGLASHAAEELLYRGLLLLGMLRRHSPWKAILLAALLFAGTRLDPWQLPAALALGVFHGWVVAATGSLALPLAGVAMQAVASWLAESGAFSRLVRADGSMPAAAWVAGVVALAAGMALLRLGGLRVRRPAGAPSNVA